MIFERIIYSIVYRLKKINRILVIGKDNSIPKKSLFGCEIEIKGNNNKLNIPHSSIIRNTKIVINGNNITMNLGTNILIKGGEIWLEDENVTLNIDNDTTVESAHIAVTENSSTISIGKGCMLANNVEIRCGDSHAIFDELGNRINCARNIVIGDNVWIGSKAMILKGVKIAKGSVIGASSIITKSLEVPNSIYVGAPAKLVKENIKWTRERINKL